ncbi:MAG TPA: monovalent cation/H+ antiporter complex subunit F [Candidatus Marinimicrobia bacterium]|jgi:multicomponent Na+:H+ antiporter subunit F|nr:monovalent cation/H+ antiporter complex subunit F [Candidatus Neomarinimicrobiota bacterium]
MRVLRWVIGLILIGAFMYANFFIYTASIYVKLINVILFSALFVIYRVIVGPTAADRIVAVDILGILIIGMLALLGLNYDQSFFMDIGLIWALLSFIASLAFAKVLEGRSLDD